MLEVKGLKEVEALLQQIQTWADSGSKKDALEGASNLVKDYKGKIRKGQGADGSPLPKLSDTTLGGPIRRETDTRTRRYYGANPLSATGALEESIAIVSKNNNEIEIASNTARGDKILASNATSSHAGDSPFSGDVSKPVRDPLQVTDKQMDIMEKALADGLDRILR